MKRCPECDFIYEEEQCLCDMDGTALVHDAHIQPEGSTQLRPSLLRLVRLPLALAVSASLLAGLGFHILKNQTESHGSDPRLSMVAKTRGSEKSLTLSAIAPSLSPISEESGRKMKVSVDERVNTKRESALKSLTVRSVSTYSGSAVKTPRAPMAFRRDARTENSAAKKESGIGTFLKKTGRLLKKPFRR